MWSAECFFRAAGLLIQLKLTICKRLEYDDDLSLSRSLGFSFETFKKDTADDRLQRRFLEKYQEIMQASREIEGLAEDRERRLQPGNHLDIFNDIDNYHGHRHNTQLRSVAKRRRARPLAARRDKLNSQSLRSHMEHTLQSSLRQPAFNILDEQ